MTQHMIKEPAWLLAKVDQRVAALTARTPEAMVKQYDTILTVLEEPRPGATAEEMERWERTCSNCGTYVPTGQLFYGGQCAREWGERIVLVTYGACPECVQLPRKA